jgi:hypothetical protein
MFVEYVGIAFFVAVAALSVYLSALATWSISRDIGLPIARKGAWLALVWLIPLLGAFIALRFAAEFSPESLPARAFLAPIRRLLSTRVRRPNDNAPNDDVTTDPSMVIRVAREIDDN